MDPRKYDEILVHLKKVDEFKEIIKFKLNDELNEDAFHLMSGNLKIQATNTKNDQDYLIPLLIKLAEADGTFRTELSIGEKFIKEANFYQRLLSEMSLTIGKPELLDLFPRSYYASLDVPNELIILEDLTEKGFQANVNPFEVDLEIFHMAMKLIAEFHAAGIAYKWRQPKDIKDILSKLHLKNILKGNHFEKLIRYTWRRGIDAAEKDGRIYSGTFKKKFEHLIRFEYENLINDDGPWRTICHGDFVINNVMFTKKQMKLIDMQMVCYSSVGIDLSNFIYISTRREFRKKHLPALLHLYHEEFLMHLMELTNSTRENLELQGFTFNLLTKEFKKCIPYSYRICSYFIGLLMEPEIMLDCPRNIIDDEIVIPKLLKAGGSEKDRILADILFDIETSQILDLMPEEEK